MPLGSKTKTKPTPPTHTASPSSGPTPPSPARKAPHCRKCHRPRKGHPARGCPYVEVLSSPTVSDDESEDPPPPLKPVASVKSPKSPPQRMPLLAKGPQKNEATPPPYEDTITPTRSSTSKKVSKETTNGATARRAPSPAFKVWQEESSETTVPQTPPKRSLRSSKTPEAPPAYDANSKSKSKSKPKSNDKPLPLPPLSAPPDSSYQISSGPKTSTPNPSSARRAVHAAFISELAEQAGASIHLVPSPKAKTIEKEAHALGLVTQVYADEDSDEALLVVGRCQFAVDRFLHMGGGRRATKPFGSAARGRTSV